MKTVECRAVIFDLFGTIVGHYSRAADEQFFTDLAALAGAPRADLLRVFRETGTEALTGGFVSTEEDMHLVLGRLLPGPVPAPLIAEAVKLKLDLVRGILHPRPTTLETLSHLKSNGFLLGLISGCAPDVPELWPECAFAEYITSPVFSCEVGVNKPDARIYEICCDRLGVVSSDCLYVADGASGELSAARRCGMSAILLRTVLEDVYDPIREDVQNWDGMAIDDLTELKQIVTRRQRGI